MPQTTAHMHSRIPLIITHLIRWELGFGAAVIECLATTRTRMYPLMHALCHHYCSPLPFASSKSLAASSPKLHPALYILAICRLFAIILRLIIYVKIFIIIFNVYYVK